MRRISSRLFLLLLIFVIGLGAYLYLRPVPQVTPVSQITTPPKTTAISLPWPTFGQAALGASGYGVLASHNTASPIPIASISKIIAALAILQQKPLAASSEGSTITFDSTDVDYFNYYYTHDGSVVPVQVGGQLTELQALEAMLIPSANNIADSLARWAFGSTDNYVTYANKMVKGMGLTHTTVGGASGFGDVTTSTADDLVKLGLAALQNPTIAQVVSQPTANIPLAGTVKNLNWLLGQDGVVGIKTGNTDKAGGCFLFAAKHQIAGQNITVVGAILGASELNAAISAARPLLQTVDSGFTKVTIIRKNQVMGYYQTPWGKNAQLLAGKDLSLLAWKGADIKILNEPEAISAPAKAGSSSGSVTVQSSQQTASSPLLLAQELPGPSWSWRLIR